MTKRTNAVTKEQEEILWHFSTLRHHELAFIVNGKKEVTVPACPKCEKISALILAAPVKKVSRERVKYWIPCTCIDDYKDRGLDDPTCPYHSVAVGWEDLLNELGIEVAPKREEG